MLKAFVVLSLLLVACAEKPEVKPEAVKETRARFTTKSAINFADKCMASCQEFHKNEGRKVQVIFCKCLCDVELRNLINLNLKYEDEQRERAKDIVATQPQLNACVESL